MKRCLACDHAYEADVWICPSCGTAVGQEEGFPAFAPELAFSNDGFAPDAHEELEFLQAKSFWFRARNRLICDLAQNYFEEAKNGLEVGCGTGFVLHALQGTLPNAQFSGSELYLSGLGYAHNRTGGTARLFQMDAREIPFEDEFDLICAFDVLEHIEEDEQVLREMVRASKKRGGILLAVPQHPWLWSKNDDLAYHKRRYRRGELETKCRTAGLDVLFSSSFVTTLLPAVILQRFIFGRAENYDPAREHQTSSLIQKTFEMLLDWERKLISRGFRLPVGTSRFVVARKP